MFSVYFESLKEYGSCTVKACRYDIPVLSKLCGLFKKQKVNNRIQNLLSELPTNMTVYKHKD